MAYNKTLHKYILKTFYKLINIKKYKLQILQYNICHTNIFTMQNILLVKIEIAKKKKVIINTPTIKFAWVYNTINIWLKYN